jgi:hypothetical protein
MKKTHLILVAILFYSTSFISAQPIITSFLPSMGAPGTTVNISGSNFNSVPANNVVYFGPTKAFVNAASTTSINVTVPSGANYQYISVTDITTQFTSYSLMPFNVTALPCSNSAFFSTYSTESAGSNINNVSIGDVDGDGLTDIVSVDARLGAGTNGYVSIIRNTSSPGNITFAPEINFPTRNYPVSVAIGDMDGDGKPELIVANSESDTISVFKNISTAGTISFIPSVELLSGSKPYCIAINDLDGDGKPDITVANFISNSVSILKNTTTAGIISFAAKIDYAASTGAYSVAIGDLDGDSKPDLGVSCMNSNTLSVFKNTSATGVISFAPKIDFVTGSAPYVVQMGDIDLDGKLDLAVSNSGSSSVSVFRNTSSIGTISFAPKVSFSTTSGPLTVAIADLDGDGKPELSTSNLNTVNNSVLKNTGTTGSISFAPNADYTNSSLGWGNNVVGDLDGDGRPELITGGTYNIGILQNQCTTGIIENTINGITVNVYPNPFESYTTIQFSNDRNEPYSLTLFNSYGQVLRKIDNITNGSVAIERDQLKSGVYFFKLSSNSDSYKTGKLIIK